MTLNKKNISLGIVLGIFILFCGSYASAFGVGAAYHPDYPLKLIPGETVDIVFNMQNMVGSSNLTAKASIIKGSEVMTLIDPSDTYFIPLKGEANVNIRVSIPANVAVGTTYPAEMGFATVTESHTGTFGFGSSIGRKFDIIVIAPTGEVELAQEKGISTGMLSLIIAIIVITIIIIIVLIKRKKRRK